MVSVFMIPRWRLTGLTLLSALLVFETACQKVPLLAPSGSVITLTSTATVLPFNGTTTIAAQVIEAAGTPPHSGTHVTFTTTLGTIQPSDAETDSSGIARATFSAGAQSGTATINAISGGSSVGANGAVKILVGSAGVGRVNVSASPVTLPPGGFATIAASVLDVNGNPLTTVPVTFSTTAGNLTASQVPTDSNGVAQTSLQTFTSATVTASVGAQGSTTPPSTGSGTGTGGGGTGSGGTGGGTTTPSTSGQASGSVTVNVATPPTVIVTPVPPTQIHPVDVAVQVQVIPPVGVTITFTTVNWGDGSGDLSVGAINGNVTLHHVFNSAGTFLITVTVTDSAGVHTSGTATVTVS
jgi:Big-like domain-containing protein/PKD domain-containing protein